MSLLTGIRRTLLGGAVVAAEYVDKVLATQPANLIVYWPLWETSGAVADNYEGTAARDGAYTGVTLGQTGIGDGHVCPLFDGANDYVDIYSASLDAAFDPSEGTILLWWKVSDSGVWTDSAGHTSIWVAADTQNRIGISKTATNNTLRWRYEANNVEDLVNKSGVSSTGWLTLGITWSILADEVKAYYNGSQEGSTQTGLGTWAGVLDSAQCVIGAFSTIPQIVMDGYLAHAAIWTTPLTPAEMAILAVV